MHSKAITTLYDEHDVILDAIAMAEELLDTDDFSTNSDSLLWFISFFREYGDSFHHQKEEDILFSLLEEKNPVLADIIQALTEHHQIFREDLSSAERAIAGEQFDNATEILRQYLSNLRDHISAENDDLFVTAEQLLDEDEKEKLFYSFLDKDRELGENIKKDFENKIQNRS